jgi:hypothetical protein
MKPVFTNIKDIKQDLKKAGKELLLVEDAKQAKFAGFKTTPSKPSPEQLVLINQYTRKEYTADDFYIGQIRLANNAIDRDNERFSEEVLIRFAATALRKTMMFDHSRDSQESAVGKFFDVTIEKLPLQQANAETGETFQLPAGMNEVWFLTVSFFIPVKGVDEKVIVKIDTGIFDWASIGFRCESMAPIMDKEGAVQFWEYRGKGPRTEMTEGSLVYLGAQHGMSVKGLDSENPQSAIRNHKSDVAPHPDGKGKSLTGGSTMELTKLLAMLMRLFPGKTFTTEDAVESEVRLAIEATSKKAAEDAVGPLSVKIAELEPLKAKVAELEPNTAKVKELTDKVAELTPLAAHGKAFHDGLIVAYVKAKALLKEVSEKPEDQEKMKKTAAAFDIDFLKTEVVHLEKRVAAALPAGSELGGTGDPEGKKKEGEKKPSPLKPKK